MQIIYSLMPLFFSRKFLCVKTEDVKAEEYINSYVCYEGLKHRMQKTGHWITYVHTVFINKSKMLQRNRIPSHLGILSFLPVILYNSMLQLFVKTS